MPDDHGCRQYDDLPAPKHHLPGRWTERLQNSDLNFNHRPDPSLAAIRAPTGPTGPYPTASMTSKMISVAGSGLSGVALHARVVPSAASQSRIDAATHHARLCVRGQENDCQNDGRSHRLYLFRATE